MKSSALSKLTYIHNDPNRKSWFLIVLELLNESIKRKQFAKEYFTRFVYRKQSLPLHHFLTDQEIGVLQLSRVLHTDASVELLSNKLKFYSFCVDHDIPTPKIMAYSFNGAIHDFNQVYAFVDSNQWATLLNKWLKQSAHQSLFIKPTSANGGRGAFRIDEQDLNDEQSLNNVLQAIHQEDYIIQETIVQHPVLHAINPSAINTVRIDTYKPVGESSRVMSALIRFGRKGHVVDNISHSVGFFVKLDLETHQLVAPGIQMAYVGDQVLWEHPDTKMPLDGVRIPYVEQIINLVNKATEAIGDRLVGWDVCVGENGPIIIEGNHNYHMVMQELAYGGYKNHPDFIRVLKEENLV